MKGNLNPSRFHASSHFMEIALKLSERGRGYTEPNPLVGAVVVKNGRILATGYHAFFGGPHAERMALERVSMRETILYVTLEPCCHYGKTPPCTDLLVEKGVRNVVVALKDPNPQVNGRGLESLKRLGIHVQLGLLEEWACDINRHYLQSMEGKRPYFAVHAGVSVDGKLSDRNGNSRWITSDEMRAISHSLRGEFSAILAGRGTVEKDNPQLTIRDPFWRGKSYFRIVLDTHNSLSPDLRLFSEQERFPLIIFSGLEAERKGKKSPLHFFVATVAGQLLLGEICRKLSELGIASVLVEGGSSVIDSFIQAGLVDEFYLFVAPKMIGGKSSAELFPSGVSGLDKSIGIKIVRLLSLANGILLQGVPVCSPGL